MNLLQLDQNIVRKETRRKDKEENKRDRKLKVKPRTQTQAIDALIGEDEPTGKRKEQGAEP